MKILDLSFHDVGKLNRTILEKTQASRATLVVPDSSSALIVIRRIQPRLHRMVISLGARDQVTGVFAPKWVHSQYLRNRAGAPSRDLEDILEEIATDQSEIARNFRHEWLNKERPHLFLCSEGHYVDACPCGEHPSSTCKPE